MQIGNWDDMKHLQRIDLPLQIYQSKGFYDNQLTKKLSKLPSYQRIMLALAIILLCHSIYLIVNQSSIFLGVFIEILLGFLCIIWYFSVEKQAKDFKELLELNLPDIYPLIILDNKRLQAVNRKNQFIVDVPIEHFKSLYLREIKHLFYLDLTLKHHHNRQSRFTLYNNQDTSNVFVKIAQTYYPVSINQLIYLVNLVIFLRNKNPDRDYFTFDKRHFINEYPINDKWLDHKLV